MFAPGEKFSVQHRLVQFVAAPLRFLMEFGAIVPCYVQPARILDLI
jgi:hypothetical protein